MVAGKVLKYDEIRGYGFAAPDSGGEDVFIHANDVEFDKSMLTVGARIEFNVEESDRGLKASHVKLVEAAPPGAEQEVRIANENGRRGALTARELSDELTEGLLRAVPTMTADNILRVRQYLIGLAHRHGWIDGGGRSG